MTSNSLKFFDTFLSGAIKPDGTIIADSTGKYTELRKRITDPDHQRFLKAFVNEKWAENFETLSLYVEKILPSSTESKELRKLVANVKKAFEKPSSLAARVAPVTDSRAKSLGEVALVEFAEYLTKYVDALKAIKKFIHDNKAGIISKL